MIIIAGFQGSGWVPIVLGLFLLVVFIYAFYFHAKNVLRRKELLIINDDGFYDYSSGVALGDKLVKWEDVRDIKIGQIKGKEFITVFLVNPSKYIDGTGQMSKKLAQSNAALGFGEINISLGLAKKENIDEVCNYMMNLHAKHNGGVDKSEELHSLDELNEK